MSKASYRSIDYSLRSNKNIERKIVFDALSRMPWLVSPSGFEYLGLGSIWFVDFVMAHKRLGITNAVSIESRSPQRAEANRPYKTVEVVAGTTHSVFPTWGSERWEKPKVAWLDYDGVLNSEVVNDLRVLVNNLAPLSVLMVTVRSGRDSYRDSGTVTGIETGGSAVLEEILGQDSISDDFTLGAGGPIPDPAPEQFPAFLASSLLNFLSEEVRLTGRAVGGEALVWLPLFDLAHRDGAHMSTIGGALLPSTLATSIARDFKEIIGWDRSKQRPKHRNISLEPITPIEKARLDQLMPHTGRGSIAKKAQKNGVHLAEGEYAKYVDLYSHFPLFLEMQG